MPRVVLDTCVIVSAFRSRTGASLELLRAVQVGRLILLATPNLFLEYEEVLKRSAQRRISGLSLEGVDAVLNALAVVIEPVDVYFRWRPQLTDSDDELVLEAAINGRAAALVTHNVRDFFHAAPRFGIRIMRPGELLRSLIQ